MRLRSIFFSLLLILFCGCTRNNGDIGKWFGKWQVEKISTIGNPIYDNGSDQFFWEFQNNIIKMVCVAPTGYDHEIYYCIGTWKQNSENSMTFDFSHTDDSNIFHHPFAEMHFPTDGPFTLTIVSENGKRCVFKRLDETTGIEFYYHLVKR